MARRIEFQYLTPVGEIRDHTDAEEAAFLLEMYEEARDYLLSHKWCPPIVESYIGFGVGRVIAVFLFRFAPPVDGTDEWLWVVVGDLPSAYFLTDCAPDPAEALGAYCELMEDWANAVLHGGDMGECFPVTAEPTAEHAHMLLSRVSYIREKIIPTSLEPWPSEDEAEDGMG